MMTDEEHQLVAEVTKFEDLLASLQALRSPHGGECGKALVGLRRQLSGQVAEIASLARPLLDRRGDIRASDEFRRLHSTLLSKLALHQASWPAVEVVKAIDDVGYKRSAQTVDQAAAAMSQWVRTWFVRH
jgi:hypothetical protein